MQVNNNWLDYILSDIEDFIRTDQSFARFFPYFNFRIDEGTDGSPGKGRGINLIRLDYDNDHGQRRETHEIGVEYYEEHSNKAGSSRNSNEIKNKAERFYNWINSGYTRGFGKASPVDPACPNKAATVVENIIVNNKMMYAMSDKDILYGRFIITVTRRNDNDFRFPS